MHRVAFFCLFLVPTVVLSQDDALKEARTRWLKGNYAEAQSAYESLIKKEKPQSAAFIGLSRAFQSQGEYDKALATIEGAVKERPKDTALLARHAELLYLRGRWEEAEKAADQAIAIKDQEFLARWIKAQILRDRGDLERADQAFRWFVRTYTQRSNECKDITDPEELALVGRAGVENANAHSITDQFSFILNDLYSDALKSDKDYWFVELQAGELLMEKYNRGEAFDAFDKALKINPNAAEAMAGKAQASLQLFEIKEADQLADQALKINPKLTSAIHVKIDLNLLAGDLKAARKHIDNALAVNPRDEQTLGRLGALYVIHRNTVDLEKLEKQLLEQTKKPGLFYHELAERIEERRNFDVAERYYKKAIELRPEMPWSRNGLGLLYMRMGKEDEARKQLAAAFETDKFNVRVANSIKVLKHLDSYKTITTKHFDIRYDPKNDAILARYMADMLEQLYAEYAKQFNYEPKNRILVEVFNNHEMFSGRTIALPDLHTIGACTGRMFAMVSPKGRGIPRAFNWGRVIRHELVHIFNLEQTDLQVPHWLTEGLAVSNEGFARPPLWNQVLVDRVAKNELLHLENITMAFVRPRDQLEWNLAYCQSLLYVEYVKKTHGQPAIGRLLDAYRDGKADADALQYACGVDKPAFEKGYKQYVLDLAKSLRGGKSPTQSMTLTQLQEANEKNPDDLEIAARLADRLVSRDAAKARKLADGVLAKKKDHAVASVVIARLDAKAGRTEEAIKSLEAAMKKDDPDTNVVLALGRLHAENGANDKAAELFELGRSIDPTDPIWLEELAKIYKKSDNQAKRMSVLLDLVATDADEFATRKLLAAMLVDAGKFAEAEKVARDALEINLLDEDVQESLMKALKGQKKDEEATRIKKLLQD
jgi:tetratricopeptide (TPR) repeat protein